MPSVYLADRAVIKITGEDVPGFLKGLVTCTVPTAADGTARYGALLTPQGKIIVDFILIAAPQSLGGGYFLDAPLAMVPDLTKRIGFYNIRKSVMVEDVTKVLAVGAQWGEPADLSANGLAFADPRLADLGQRVIGARFNIEAFGTQNAEAYNARRIALGIPEGGKDFAYGDVFPHEVDMDQFDGIDFKKGCYVGQEVVARMQYRTTARNRVVPVVFGAGVAAQEGIDVVAGEKRIGTLGSVAGGRGLALLRLDKVGDAMAAGQEITAGGLSLSVERPEWASFTIPPASA